MKTIVLLFQIIADLNQKEMDDPTFLAMFKQSRHKKFFL